MKKIFPNRQNEEIKFGDKTYWISRSVAVVGVHIATFNDEQYVLIEKRSKKMDCPGKWAVVSGYLDWDESAYQAVVRETFEETGFDMHLDRHIRFDNNKEPIYVKSDPAGDAKQNVTLGFLFIYNYPAGLPLEVEIFRSEEVEEVRWLNVKQLQAHSVYKNPANWAFNHDTVIKQTLEKYKSLFKW